MKSQTVLLLLVFLIAIPSAYTQQIEQDDDKTLSPFFFVQSEDAGLDQLPLKSTEADVHIAGIIADVVVTQTYKNEGKKPLEAIYIFPASTRAAVYHMVMRIGERTIVARIDEREKARLDYEKARAEGKSASLLEQMRPNVFQMNVANIMPGDVIKVELSYTELLVPTDNEYEFIYPTVVGPRYSNMPENQAGATENWVKNPYMTEGKEAPYDFDIKVDISTGIPIKEIFSSSHKVNINYNSKASASIDLGIGEEKSGNRDYILKYRLAGDQIESGILLYEGKEENFFLAMVQPPVAVSERQIPPREYIFIVDVSGSMHGFPLDISKKLLSDLIGNLRPVDKFNILLFASGSSLLAPVSLAATEANVQKAISMIDSQRGGGGTELLSALKRALSLPASEEYSRSIVIATDGYVHVEKEAFDLIRKNLGRANFFSFGIGSSVNRYIIEGMANVGMGESFVITKPTEAAAKADRFRKYIQTPVLTSIRSRFNKFKAYDVEPLAVPDLLAQRPVVLYGKWRGDGEGSLRISGYAGNGELFEREISISRAKNSASNQALKYLWARKRIALLADYNRLGSDDARVKEITALGLKYNLLTDFTSFVAIDSKIRNQTGQTTTVQQPLPLPQNVSGLAVAGSMAGSGYSYSTRQKLHSGVSADLAEVAVKAEEKEDKPAAKKTVLSIGQLKTNDESFRLKVLKSIQGRLTAMQKCVSVSDAGTVTLHLVIDSSGKVKTVRILSSTLKNRKIEACLQVTIRKWVFRNLNNSKDIEVTCPLKFSL